MGNRNRINKPKRGPRYTFPCSFYNAIKKLGISNKQMAADLKVPVGRIENLICGVNRMIEFEYNYFMKLCAAAQGNKESGGTAYNSESTK